MAKRMNEIPEIPELKELSADDLALLSAVIVVIGDLFGLFAVLKARTEKD
ncbi:hypothetical protein A8990_107178 [Paenibacillus taihuensis]|uniref:Uncharacterized protein n=1 Tax=Paenibacillus taihuensis TaxID=1156355 RepID=A0A3D9S7D5_9BACL|nr:hypothetical protein [Paenibacillus taihuensis]REE89080.1 hypothetical protein A8990_107178 [Paenibacillus taihuensis]